MELYIWQTLLLDPDYYGRGVFAIVELDGHILHINTSCYSYRIFQRVRTFCIIAFGLSFFREKIAADLCFNGEERVVETYCRGMTAAFLGKAF